MNMTAKQSKALRLHHQYIHFVFLRIAIDIDVLREPPECKR